MQLVISFLMTNFNVMRQHWAKHSTLKNDGKVGTDVSIKKETDLGGMIIKLDWERKKIITKKEINCPSGFDCEDKYFFVNSMMGNTIFVLDYDFRTKEQISNPLFNDLHSLSITKKGMLLTSTGLDAILEVDQSGRILFEWFATENGFPLDQYGNRRELNKKIDHRTCDYPTLLQSTHINSAIYANEDEKTIIASLFHEGTVIDINTKTRKPSVLLKGLSNPHSVYRNGTNNYIVSNTRGSEVILFRGSGKIIERTIGDYNWIQDSIVTSNGNYLIADSNNHRIIETNRHGVILDTYHYPKQWKIYQIKEVVS